MDGIFYLKEIVNSFLIFTLIIKHVYVPKKLSFTQMALGNLKVFWHRNICADLRIQ